jgi:hypothetical protein
MLGNSCLAEQPVAFPEGLSSKELVLWYIKITEGNVNFIDVLRKGLSSVV